MSKPPVWLKSTEVKNEQVEYIPASKSACGDCGDSTVTELTGSSQPQRLLKVTRAFNTWKRGISKSKDERTRIKIKFKSQLYHVCDVTSFHLSLQEIQAVGAK